MQRFPIGPAFVIAFMALAGAVTPASFVHAATSQTASPPAASDATTVRVLEQLDQIGRNLRAFSAKLRLTETDNALGTSLVRSGHVYFQRLPDGSARIHVIFNWRQAEDSKLAFPEKIEYLLDGPWLIDRNYKTKNEARHQVLKPGQKMDLFKLGEGPFPLPIGQNPQDVQMQFEVKRVQSGKDDPADTVHLELTPRAGTNLSRKFHVIEVWVGEKTHMPMRVDTVDPKQQTTRSTELSDIVVNPPGGLPDADFQLPNIDGSWNRSVDSLEK